jgi:hypothetical protein
MATATTSTIVSLFESRTAAERAVSALVGAGYDRDQLSIVTSDPRTGPATADTPDLGPRQNVGSGLDAGTGAAIGGIAGFIGGIVALAIPGIGPIIAAGPLAAGIMGAGIGAATGGVVGALKTHGVPEEDASRFSAAIARGRVMVTAHVPSNRVDDVADLLDRHGAIDVDETAEHVTGGAAARTPLTTARPSADAVKFDPELESVRDRQRRREHRVHVYPGITGGGSQPNA